MTNEIKLQLLHFLSEVKTTEELKRLSVRINNISEGNIPEDLQKEIDKRKTELA